MMDFLKEYSKKKAHKREGRTNGWQIDSEEYPKGEMESFRQKKEEKGGEAIAFIFSNEEACLLSHPESVSNPHMVARDQWIVDVSPPGINAACP